MPAEEAERTNSPSKAFDLTQLSEEQLVILYMRAAVQLNGRVRSQDIVDLVHDALLKIVQTGKVYDPNRSTFSTWAYQFVRRLAANHVRKTRRHNKLRVKSARAVYEVPSKEPPVSVRIQVQEYCSKAVNSLTDSEREFFFAYTEFGVEGAAEALEISMGAAYQRISRIERRFLQVEF